MHLWEKTYKQRKFKIDTLQPSVVVRQNAKLFCEGNKILDIGCGNGRNTIFAAKKKCLVDAFDVADLDWLDPLSIILKNRIHFQKQDIEDYLWIKCRYHTIILTRVIQYIDFINLGKLIKDISESLKNNGTLLLSYTKAGGIHNKKEIKVPKFAHKLEQIETLLKKYFKKVKITKGSVISAHVSYVEPIESYDIVCSK